MGQLYLIQVIGAVGGGSPDNSLPPMIGGGPIYPPYPDQGLPPGVGGGPVYPPQVWPRPPSGNRPDQGLPGQPPYPDQGLPGGGGYYPDQGLPGGGGSGAQPKPAAANVPPKPSSPPSGGQGQYVLVMVAPGVARWAWVAGGSVDNTLPGQPGAPDQGLPPTSPGAPDQGLPPTSPGAPDQGLPPQGSTKPNPVPTPQRR